MIVEDLDAEEGKFVANIQLKKLRKPFFVKLSAYENRLFLSYCQKKTLLSAIAKTLSVCIVEFLSLDF